MIVSHLECEQYKKIYDNFYEIIKIQDEYNKKINCFFIIYTNYICRILGRSVDDNVLRFYFYSINKDICYSQKDSEKYSYINKPFNILFSQLDKDVSNPFTKEEEGVIRQSMIDNYDRVSDWIKDFKNQINELNRHIKTFRISLDDLLGDGNEKIKGKCYVEKDLNPFNRSKRHSS